MTRNNPLERLRDATTDKLPTHSSFGRRLTTTLSRLNPFTSLSALMALGLLGIVAIDPALAQAGDACSGPLQNFMLSFEGMVFGYGRWVIPIMFFIGLVLWQMAPMFIGQSQLGFAMFALSIASVVVLVFGIQFFNMGFEAAGDIPQSCSDTLG